MVSDRDWRCNVKICFFCMIHISYFVTVNMLLIKKRFTSVHFKYTVGSYCCTLLQEEKNCGAPCHAMFFAEKERTLLRYWVASWAAVCCGSCLFTVNHTNTHIHFPVMIYWLKCMCPTSGAHLSHRSIALPLPGASDRLSGRLLFGGRLCVRRGPRCRRFGRLPRAVRSARSAARPADVVHDNAGMCDESSRIK